jgi:uncharacterized protein YbjT (DUF2867 family)
MSDATTTNTNTTNESPAGKPTLVLGGTGKTGRRVVERLEAQGLPVRIGSRSATPAFDWEDPSGWDAVLGGVAAVYIAYQPDLAVPGSDRAITTLVEKAEAAGVERLVLLSGRGEPEAEVCEKIVLGSAIDATTVVRASWFMQNFDESYFIEGLLAGEVVLPLSSVPEPFIDVRDIADVAVAALTAPGHAGRVYEVTGPRMLTFPEVVASIAAATGRDIRFVQVPMDDWAGALRAEGTPDEVVDLLVYLFSTVLDGRNASVADGVQQALGRPARDFEAYVEEAAATGVWQP